MDSRVWGLQFLLLSSDSGKQHCVVFVEILTKQNSAECLFPSAAIGSQLDEAHTGRRIVGVTEQL